MKNQPILVIGATGFLGKKLTDSFYEKRVPFEILTRQSSNTALFTSRGIKVHKGNFSDINFLKKVISKKHTVILLAGKISTAKYDKKCYTNNINLAESVIRSIVSSSEKPHLIYASSIAVYTLDPTKQSGQWSYAESKLYVEKLIKKYERYGLSSTILRIGDVIDRGSIWQNDIITIATKGLLFLPKRNQGCLNYIFANDVVSAIEKTLENKNALKHTYNIVSGDCVDFNKYAKDVIQNRGLLIKGYLPTKIIRIISNMNDILHILPPGFSTPMIDYITSSRQINSAEFTNLTGWKPQIHYTSLINQTKM